MDAYPNQRFAKLRHGEPEHANATTTFLGANAEAAQLTIESHGVLARIAQADPARAQLVLERLRELMTHDAAVMAWLEADPQNATLFAHDPVAGLRQAIPDLPATFFDGWGTVGPSQAASRSSPH